MVFISLANSKWKISISVSWSLKYLKKSPDTPKITSIALYPKIFIMFISQKVCSFQMYIFEAIICNIVFPHQLEANKPEMRTGFGTPRSNFFCTTSKQNNCLYHNLYGWKFLKITFKICPQVCPPYLHPQLVYVCKGAKAKKWYTDYTTCERLGITQITY